MNAIGWAIIDKVRVNFRTKSKVRNIGWAIRRVDNTNKHLLGVEEAATSHIIDTQN